MKNLQLLNKQLNNNQYFKFKSHIIFTSRKKLIFFIRQIKNLTLEKAYMFFYCNNKKFCKPIIIFIKYIINQLINLNNITENEAKKFKIKYAVIEKTNIKKYDIRYACKGRGNRSITIFSRLNIIINNE